PLLELGRRERDGSDPRRRRREGHPRRVPHGVPGRGPRAPGARGTGCGMTGPDVDRRAEALLRDLERAWARTDALFGLLAPGALTAQPIALRQPFIFYLGHLPAFAWNQVC